MMMELFQYTRAHERRAPFWMASGDEWTRRFQIDWRDAKSLLTERETRLKASGKIQVADCIVDCWTEKRIQVAKRQLFPLLSQVVHLRLALTFNEAVWKGELCQKFLHSHANCKNFQSK